MKIIALEKIESDFFSLCNGVTFIPLKYDNMNWRARAVT